MELIFVFLLGLVVGSFLNVLIDRIPRGENIVWKPSHCDFCKKTLRWFELIPLFSFLAQKGRCRRCHKRLSFQYPAIELVTGVGFVWLLTYQTSLLPFALHAVIFCAFVVLFVIDYKLQILPDSILVVLLVAILLLAPTITPQARLSHAYTSIISGLGFLGLWLGTRGRGLGFGDVKLVTLLGLLLGYPTIVIALYIAFLTGATAGVILMITHRARLKSRIAFGPFLITGAIASNIWGEQVLAWWRQFV